MEISEKRESEGLPLIQTESVAPPYEAETLNLEEANKLRKKKILIGIGIGIAIIGVILAIVLPIVLHKKPVPPQPGPKPPVDFYNPYEIVPKSVQILPSRTTGIMKVA
jgi:hypothetical protein